VPLRNNNVAGATDRQIHYVTFGRFGPERTARFLGGNALSFLGFDDPSNKAPQSRLEVDHVHHPCLFVTRPAGLVKY
jgi:hypothetical protein